MIRNNTPEFKPNYQQDNYQELTIQELMEGYIMPNDFNTDLLLPQELSDAEQQKILQQTLNRTAPGTAAPRRAQRRGLPRRRMLVFTLAAVMLLVMSSLALAEFALNKDFFGFFNASNGQLPHQSGQEINQQVTNNGATLTVEQVLGDKQTIYVLLDFVAPEGVVLAEGSYQWDQAYVWLSESKGCGYSFETLPDDDPTDNRVRMMLCLNADDSLQGQNVDLTLGDLKLYDIEKMDYTTVVVGEWKLSFKLDYTPSSQVIAQDLTIMLGEAEIQLISLEISPLTMILNLQISNAEGYVAPEGYVEPQGGGVEILDDGTELRFDYADSPAEVKLGDILSDFDYFTVTLKDGTVLPTRGGGSNSDGSRYQIIFEFGEILNFEEIASINYMGYELKLQ